MRFKSKEDLVYAVKLWHIKNHYQYDVTESDKKVWNIVCKEKDT